MSKGIAIICTFDSAGHLTGRKRTYEAVKAAVLEVGRFSVFEATENAKNARLFTRLHHDPEIEIVREESHYPWIAVRRKSKAEIER
jgi:hypothetical protein